MQPRGRWAKGHGRTLQWRLGIEQSFKFLNFFSSWTTGFYSMGFPLPLMRLGKPRGRWSRCRRGSSASCTMSICFLRMQLGKDHHKWIYVKRLCKGVPCVHSFSHSTDSQMLRTTHGLRSGISGINFWSPWKSTRSDMPRPFDLMTAMNLVTKISFEACLWTWMPAVVPPPYL